MGVIGPKEMPEILPIVELDFGATGTRSKPTISDREVKFGPETEGSPKLVHRPEHLTRSCASASSGRRCSPTGGSSCRTTRASTSASRRTDDPYVLEVNPNPYLEDKSELAHGAPERRACPTPSSWGASWSPRGKRYGLAASRSRRRPRLRQRRPRLRQRRRQPQRRPRRRRPRPRKPQRQRPGLSPAAYRAGPRTSRCHLGKAALLLQRTRGLRDVKREPAGAGRASIHLH